MSQLERIYKMDRMFRRKRPPGKTEILTAFEISLAQFKRDLDFFRTRLGANVGFDAQTGGYCYQGDDFNLPGLWFSQGEVYALLLMESLIEQLQPGLVRDQLKPFEGKLRSLLGKHAHNADAIRDRMQITNAPLRPVDPEHFQTICDAALRQKKLRMRYYSRYRNTESDRTVSPQRVIYYRGNWYLDAWCHQKSAVRRFALDAVRVVAVLDEPGFEVPATEDAEGYGIFSGPAGNSALLVFDDVASRWVAEELWHPRQRATALPEGRLQLEVPYSNQQEILMDILRHGAHVEVVRPASLRNAVAEAHRDAMAIYATKKRPVASAPTAKTPEATRIV